MNNLLCYSFHEFRNIVNSKTIDPNKVAIISIIESKDVCPKELKHIMESSDSVLNLDFDDIDGDSTYMSQYDRDDNGNIIYNKYMVLVPFKPEMAKQSIEFINNNLGKDFIIHCFAGISRSQAYVRFMLDCYPEYFDLEHINKDNPPRFPNYYVLSMLKRAYRGDVFGDLS